MPRLKWTFLLAIVLGAAMVMTVAALQRSPAAARATPLVNGVWISGQVEPAELAAFKVQGINSIVALRPDDEVAGQPSSAEMARAAQAQDMAFTYAPVPRGSAVPDEAVEALGKQLASGQPMLLYCQSGQRAARTWALAEASRPGGLDAAAILAAVKAAGRSADDLGEQIAARFAARPTHR